MENSVEAVVGSMSDVIFAFDDFVTNLFPGCQVDLMMTNEDVTYIGLAITHDGYDYTMNDVYRPVDLVTAMYVMMNVDDEKLLPYIDNPRAFLAAVKVFVEEVVPTGA